MKLFYTATCMAIICAILSTSAAAQPPQRKAFAGLRLEKKDSLVVIDSITPVGSFAGSRVQKGDVLLQVNTMQMRSVEDLGRAFANIRNGTAVSIQYSRGKKVYSEKIQAVSKPLVQLPGAEVLYDWVAFRGGWLRTITYKPNGKQKTPAILLIPGYGCGSIENFPASYNGKMISAWIREGYAVVTIEKSGMGDSWDCEPCQEVDLATDIESFDAGYRYMESLPFADAKNLFIWGHSMGGTIAPEVARRHQPKGVMVFACVFRPWSEFLPEMHRVQKPLMEGLDYAATEDFMKGIQKIYYEFFVLKKSPAELYQNSAYSKLVTSELNYKPGSNNMWGRHWRFWQQLDSVNMATSWRQVECPVLVLHGGADYEQCSVVEPFLITETVNERQKGSATWVTIPDLDHFMMKSADWTEAYRNFREQQYLKSNFNVRIAAETTQWLRSQTN